MNTPDVENNGQKMATALNSAGGLGAMQFYGRNTTSDARLVCNMLSLGVVSPDRVQAILEQTYGMLESVMAAGQPRETAALLKVITTAASLELKAVTADKPAAVNEHKHVHIHDDSGSRVDGILDSIRNRRRAIGTSNGNGRRTSKGNGSG